MDSWLEGLYQYHFWANRRVLRAVQTLSEEQLHQPQGQGWGSVFDTLAHMFNAEWIWLSRWNGVSPQGFLSNDELPDLPHLLQRWEQQQAELLAFVRTQTPESLQHRVVYTTTRGESMRLPLGTLMLHVVNHGTHHRGELAAMLATMRVPHHEDDLLHFWLEETGQRKPPEN